MGMAQSIETGVFVTLGDVTTEQIDRSGPSQGEFIYVDISSVDRDSKLIVDAKTLFAETAPSRARQRLRAGDVLVSMTRPNLNAVALVTAEYDGAIGSTGFHILRVKHTEPKFLFYLVQTREFIDSMCTCVQGALYPAVRPKDVESFGLHLPPLAEQNRIVAKIDELFSELDKGIENLKTAQAQLKVYRQALLKHAFEGKLTAQWRADNPNKLETADALLTRIQKEREQRYQQQVAEWEASGQKGRKPKAPTSLPPLTAEESIELPKLPQGWRWIRPEEIASQEPYSIGIGPFGSNLKVSDYRDSGVPLVFVKNITRSNFSADLKFIDKKKHDELYAHSVQALDLLITKMGDPPGDCEIYPVGAPNAVLTADCLKYRLWDKFANRHMYKHCINSNLVKRQLGLITRGVAQKKISVERFKTIALPLMAVAEQEALVDVLDSKLSEADQLDKTLDAALQQSEALRQSILKKAFSGQLVPQDPADEPAGCLLERLRAEREIKASQGRQPKKLSKRLNN